jgi:hypothetical protein
MPHKYDRKKERLYEVPYIAEFWNTLSNLPFILIGLMRICESPVYTNSYVYTLYLLLICAGLCSGVHHCVLFKYSLFVDFVPIFLSLIFVLFGGGLICISYVSWLKILLAITVLLTDHILTPINVPWGHVMWHLLACFASDSVYQDILKSHS